MIASLEVAKESAIAALRRGDSAVWRRPTPARDLITLADVDEARARFQRFEPILRQLFPQAGWDGRVRSQLLDYPQTGDMPALLVKADHDLPVTGSIKARGGVHELLCQVERIALAEGIAQEGDLTVLLGAEARSRFARHTLIVASTGNLGFSIGLLARAFGLGAEIHMSRDAKAWKKERLRALGARVVEHECDFSEAVERARVAASMKGPEAYFVDDESSRELMLGYAVAAYELAEQLAARDIVINAERPLFVYLPCGVGGAPGGVTFGLKQLFGRNAVCVFVEPTASASMFAALSQDPAHPVHVAELGLDNRTIADGLAVPRASPLALAVVGRMIDAVVAVNDEALLDKVRSAWRTAGLRLEPAAAAGFAAVTPWLRHLQQAAPAGPPSAWRNAVHVVWTTGGSLLPDHEFDALLVEKTG